MPSMKWRQFKLGASRSRSAVIGILADPVLTPAGSVTAGESTVASLILRANALAKNGYGFRLRAFGSFAANANSKRVKLYANTATTLFDSGALTGNAVPWILTVEMFRTGPSAQQLVGQFQTSTPTTVMSQAAFTLDEKIDQVLDLKLTAGTANNDVLFKALYMETFMVGT